MIKRNIMQIKIANLNFKALFLDRFFIYKNFDISFYMNFQH
jgi:hypothetical protein